MTAGRTTRALGLISGFFGGFLDGLIMRMSDVLFAFPGILLAIAIVAALGAKPGGGHAGGWPRLAAVSG